MQETLPRDEIAARTRVRSEKPRLASNVAEGIEEFTNGLYKCIASDMEGNFVVSGLSAHMALSLCSVGAKGDTADEMHKVLCHPQSDTFNDYKKVIESLNNSKSVTIGIVSKIYADNSITVNKSFKDSARSLFNSNIEEADFDINVEEAVRSINDTCAKATEGKIKEVISSDDIKPNTKLVIVNAIYFKADWLNPFSTFCTDKRPFHINKNTTVDVLTMFYIFDLVYKDLDHLNAKCIAMPYEDTDFLFIVILPNKIDGLETLETNIENVHFNYKEDFSRPYENLQRIHLYLPKFKIESGMAMTAHLKNLGMEQAFSASSADFKGISVKPILTPPLHIDSVFQKAFIEVNEKGTEAAAFTRLRMRGGGTPPPPKEFIVNRPFLYKIVNVKHSLTLFSGRVVKPQY